MIPFLLGIAILFSAANADTLAVIVNAQNPVTSVSRSQLSDFYLKKVKSWNDGVPLRVFDRSDQSEIRREFLRDIVKKSPREIELYWIGQKLYSGQSAPTQVATDSMMEIMVSRFPGGVGYVSKDFEPTRPVKKISVTE